MFKEMTTPNFLKPEKNNELLLEVLVNISKLMNQQDIIRSYVDEMNGSGGNYNSIELTAISIVIDAVIEDACEWVRLNLM